MKTNLFLWQKSWQKWFQLCNWEAGCLLHAFLRKHKLTCVENCWSIEYQSSFSQERFDNNCLQSCDPKCELGQFPCSAVNCKPPRDFVAFMVDFMAQIYIFQKGRALKKAKHVPFKGASWTKDLHQSHQGFLIARAVIHKPIAYPRLRAMFFHLNSSMRYHARIKHTTNS